MKILMICPTPFFADRGCHTRIYGEVTALQKLGHEVLVCTYGLGRDIEGVKTIRCWNFPWYSKLTAGPSFTKIMLLPILFFKSIEVIKQYEPDIVHGHLHEGALIMRFCRLLRKKPLYVFDMQGSLSGEIVQHKFVREKSLMSKFFVSLEKRINSWFPIITQSDNLYNKLLCQNISKKRIVNAMDGVDTIMFSPQSPDKKLLERYNLDYEKPIIIYMGLLEEYQGVDLMFDAFKRVFDYNNQCQFVVIGYPNVVHYQNKARNLGIEENCRFIGKVRFEEAPRYLSLAQVAIAPKISENEGDGKLYNYMAMGLGIVSFDRNISREILFGESDQECGLLAKMKDTVDLADCIIRYIENPILREKHGNNARKRVMADLSFEISAKKIEEFYKYLLRGINSEQ